MKIIPALDLQNGLSKFPFNDIDTPVDIVKQLMHYGVHTFLITDLDGVYEGHFKNIEIVQQLSNLGAELIVSGGIRTVSDVDDLIRAGAKYILVGTLALKDQETLIELIEKTGERTFVAIDTFEDSVFIEGWIEDSDVSPSEFISSTHLLGVNTFIHSKINETDDMSILSETWCATLKKTLDVHIIPVIDLTKPLSLNDLMNHSINEVIIGGLVDQFEWASYPSLRL